MAFESELSLRTLRRLEKGKVNPQLSTLLRIASALDIHPILLINIEIERNDKELRIGICPHYNRPCLLNADYDDDLECKDK